MASGTTGLSPLMPDELPVAEQTGELALAQAQLAQAVGEVPVGAVVMQGDTLIAVGLQSTTSTS